MSAGLSWRRAVGRGFAVAVGCGDAATGLALLATPRALLALLGIAVPAGGTFAFRFVGVFVACVGFAYLYPWLPPAARRGARMGAAIEWTAGVRLAVASFLAVAVAAGEPSAWLVVGFYDAAVALAQLWLRAGGDFDAA